MLTSAKWVAVLTVVSLWTNEGLAQGTRDLRIDPPARTLAYASDPWVVWTERVELESMRRAPTLHTKYFLQKLGDDEPKQIYEMHGTYSKYVLAVLTDGTVLLTYSSTLDWVSAEGETRSEKLRLDAI